MRRFLPQHFLKAVSLPLACLFVSTFLAFLPLPVPKILASLPAVSVLPAPVALAAVDLPPAEPVVAVIPVAASATPIVTPTPVVVIPKPTVVPKAREAHLLIPAIGVDAVIKSLGAAADGSMAVPANRFDVSWFKLGTRPGDVGSAVIAGHSRWARGPGAFARLDMLAVGDVLSVVDAKGVTTSFAVVGMRTFDAAELHSGIFESESGAHLNLITCSGSWNAALQDYATRLVVYTDLIPAA